MKKQELFIDERINIMNLMFGSGEQFAKDARNYAKTLEAIFPTKGEKAHCSFSEWRNAVHLVRDLLIQRLDEINTEKKRIDLEYSINRAAEKKKAIDEDYTKMCDIARDIARQDFSKVISAKRDAFRNSMKAPSEEQLRLLTALSLRQSVGSDEISYFAEIMADNLPALRCLSDVAKKNDVSFPYILTSNDLDSYINQSVDAMEKYLPSIGKEKKDLEYDEMCFWLTNDHFRESPSMDALDSPGFMRSTESNERGDMDALA